MSKDNETIPAQAPVLKSKANPPRLHYGRLKLAEYARQHHYAEIPAGCALEDILKPGFWGHYTKEVRRDDLIEAVCEDGSWEAMLRVMFVSTGEILVSTISHVVHEKASSEPASAAAYRIDWQFGKRCFRIVRKDNGAIIKDDLYPKSKALEYMEQHLKSLAA